MTSTGDRAVVLGASMAGLLAARVLADSFPHVTLVERDELPTGPADRRGVPQARQVHILLSRGGRVVEELFPGITDALAADGAVLADGGARIRFLLAGRRLCNIPSDDRDVFCSRQLLEHHVREAVRRHPGITVLDGSDVLHPVDDGARVTGVAVRPRSGAAEEVLPADLVVDATGRGSRTPVWLAETGRTPPAEERIATDTVYAGARFRLRPGALGDDVAILVSPPPGGSRGGALFAVEGGEVLVSLTGMLGEAPPDDLDGFRDYAASLAFPDLADALEGAEPVTPLRTSRFPASTRRHYERLTDLPRGLLVVGDALCSFNPVYGQGMSVAAIQAEALARTLDRGGVPEPRAWFRAAARACAPAWDLATGSDLADPRVEGPRPALSRVMNAYVDRLQAAAEHDARVSTVFLEVTGLLRPPPALLRPDVVARVAWSSARHRRRTAAGVRPSGRA